MQKLATAIISIYVTLVIYGSAFFVKTLMISKSSDQLFWNYLAIFVIIFIPIFFLMSKLVTPNMGRGAMQYLRIVLLAVVLLGMIVALLYHVIPVEPVYNLPSSIDKFFASDRAFTLWLIAPLLALFI